MNANAKEGYSRLLNSHYCYISPSPKAYPFQYFWDTCFHIVILIQLGEYDIAKKGFQSLFAMQEKNGFVGHMIFWKQVLPKRLSDVLQARPTLRSLRPHMSALIQPTFVAAVLLRLYEVSQDRRFLQEMFPKVKRYHQWLQANRDFDGDGLLTIISPFESGIDWKPSFDPIVKYPHRVPRRLLFASSLYWKGIATDFSNFALGYDLTRIKRRRKFLVKDAGFNTIYALDLEAMAKLSELAGEDGTRFRELRQHVA